MKFSAHAIKMSTQGLKGPLQLAIHSFIHSFTHCKETLYQSYRDVVFHSLKISNTLNVVFNWSCSPVKLRLVRGPDGDVGIEGNSGSDGKGEWSEMVRACVEEGSLACSEKSVGVRSEGQEEERTTKEDVDDASGEGEQERCFGGKGCHESSEMESGS